LTSLIYPAASSQHLVKVRLRLKREYGDIELEGESFDELVEKVREFPEWLEVIDSMVAARASRVAEKELLEGIVQYTVEGPAVTVSREKLKDREAVGLILYALDPQGGRPRDISRLLSLSGFLSVGFASRLSELRREGLAYKEGDLYRLSVTGKKWVEDLVSSMKGVKA